MAKYLAVKWKWFLFNKLCDAFYIELESVVWNNIAVAKLEFYRSSN